MYHLSFYCLQTDIWLCFSERGQIWRPLLGDTFVPLLQQKISLCKQYRQNPAGYSFNPQSDPGGFILHRFHDVLWSRNFTPAARTTHSNVLKFFIMNWYNLWILRFFGGWWPPPPLFHLTGDVSAFDSGSLDNLVDALSLVIVLRSGKPIVMWFMLWERCVLAPNHVCV